MNSTDRPHPRILVVGIKEESSLGASVKALGGTVDFMIMGEAVYAHEGDYSAIIQYGQDSSVLVSRHWRGIHFLDDFGEFCPSYIEQHGQPLQIILETTKARQFEITSKATKNGLDKICERSIRSVTDDRASISVIHTFRSATEKELFRASDSDGTNKRLKPYDELIFEDLVVAHRGDPIAARVRSKGSTCGTFVLPHFATHREEWINVVYDIWTAEAPGLFPSRVNEDDPMWMTPDKLAAQSQLASYQLETERIRTERQNKEDSLRAIAEHTDSVPTSGMQSILYSQGDALTHAVSEMLSDVGFAVTDSDADPKNAASKREDLQAKTSDGWVAVVEVKGYTKSPGKSTDIRQINEAAGVFYARNQRLPDARWLVINGDIDKHPSVRDEPLKSRPDAIEDFAEGGGLILPTPVLFRIWKDLKTGDAMAKNILSSLTKKRGILRYEDV